MRAGEAVAVTALVPGAAAARIAIADIYPAGPVRTKHAADLIIDVCQMLDEHFRRRLQAERAAPGPALHAGAAVDREAFDLPLLLAAAAISLAELLKPDALANLPDDGLIGELMNAVGIVAPKSLLDSVVAQSPIGRRRNAGMDRVLRHLAQLLQTIPDDDFSGHRPQPPALRPKRILVRPCTESAPSA
jgi:hypothetical protein